MRAVTRRNVIIVAACFLVAVSPVLYARGKQPKRTDGAYSTVVRGYYTGTGTGTVGSKTVTIRAKVVTDTGRSGNFIAPALVLDGGHFSGSGTAVGAGVTVTGRLDGYSQDAHFRGARFLCTYKDASGQTGRVAGVLVSP